MRTPKLCTKIMKNEEMGCKQIYLKDIKQGSKKYKGKEVEPGESLSRIPMEALSRDF